MIRRVVEQLDGFANRVSKLHHAMEKLCAYPAALRAVIHLELELFGGARRVRGHGLPAGCQCIDDEIARLGRAAKGDTQLSRLCIHHSARKRLRLTAQVVIAGFHLTAREAASGKLAELHRRFTIHAPALDVAGGDGLGVFF